MKTRTMNKRIMVVVLACCFIILNGFDRASAKDPPVKNSVKVLILLDDQYGSSLTIEDNENNILENFEEYGWEVTLASCSPEVTPCSWGELQGCETITSDILTSQLDEVDCWDMVMVAPGGTHEHLIDCPFAVNMIKQAVACNIPVSAWCKGVRMLAVADVIDGISITGHAAFEQEYLAAGADYLGDFAPPTLDNGIITCVNSHDDRQEMCELIREAVENATGLREKKNIDNESLCFKLYPNPISTSTTVEFMLDEPTKVQIAVFDQNGNMVMDVVKQKFNKGHNRVRFSPANLPTGMYYLYLFAGEKKEMRKCMII